MPMSLTTYRSSFMNVSQWEIGKTSTDGEYVNQKSNIELEWDETHLEVDLPIPGKAGPPVMQDLGNYQVKGTIYSRDLEAFNQLLYNTDVVGTSHAVTSMSRATIPYCKFTGTVIKITQTTEAHNIAGVITVAFTNMRIRTPHWALRNAEDFIHADFVADSVAFAMA